MVTVSKLMSIGIIVISLVAGFISFYVISDLSKEKRKVFIEEMVTQLINFIIFIWIGKIILNFSTFLHDPLAILAYPSNSDAFYLAVLFSSIVLIYKSKRRQIDVSLFIEAFLPVFLVASFLYEFIQLVWNNNTYSLGYMIILTILLVLFLLVRDRITGSSLKIVMIIVWSVGVLLLVFIQPFVTVFGYIMAPWFVGTFSITSFTIIIFNQRKRDRNERN